VKFLNIKSVEKLTNEIVIVDSTEKLKVPFLEVKNVRIVKHERADYVELVRNFGVSKASGKWVLVLDPDEEVTKKLAKKLITLLTNNNIQLCHQL